MNQKDRLFKEYGFHFPPDFWTFYEFWKEILDKNLNDDFYDQVGMVPVGPFHILEGEFDGKEILLPAYMHWRFRFDPPEFFSVFSGDSDGLHWGYWSDNPEDGKFVVASYYARDAFEISDNGNTLLEAVRYQLEYRLVGNLENMEDDPDYEAEYKEGIKKLDEFREILIKYGTADRKEIGEEYMDKYASSNRKMTCKTFDGMGIVVESKQFNKKIKCNGIFSQAKAKEYTKIALKAIEDGYPGNALQIGKELWAAGDEYESEIKLVLGKAYEALGRNLLKEIMLTHMEYKDNSSVDITSFVGKEFSSLENALKIPEKVVVLNLYRQKIKKLPENIGEFKNLQKINLFFNNITELPKSFFQLQKLTELILSDNPIKEIPDDIFELKSLKTLLLYNTKIPKERIEEIRAKMTWVEVDG